MKIVFAIKSMNAEGGGAERVLAEITSGLAKRGHQITILTFDSPHGRSFYRLHAAVERLNIDIGDPRRPSRFFETGRRIAAMRDHLQNMCPDVAVGFMHSMFLPIGFALAGTGIPLVASEHIVPEHYRSRPLQALLLMLTPLLTLRITVVSQQALAAYPAALRRHMSVMPNPACARSSKRSDVAGAARRRKILLAVGRLAAQKDHISLIDAFAQIAASVPDWDLRIAGEGEMRGELEAKVTAYGLERRVQMPGAIRDISAEYAGAQLFVIPSRYESFGLATAEALAHGLPAVGFADCQGTNKLIKSGVNGVLVQAGKERARGLAAALAPLMRDREARAGLEPVVGRSKKFDTETLLDRWVAMLAAVADEGRSEGYARPFRELALSSRQQWPDCQPELNGAEQNMRGALRRL